MDVVKRLNKEEKMTVILITHFMDEALEADRAIVMNQGEIVMQGTPEEIFRRSDELEIYNLALPRAAAIAKKLSAGECPSRPRSTRKPSRRKYANRCKGSDIYL